MKAAFLVDKNKYVCGEAPKPTIADGEALLAVEACAFCGSDIHDAARAPKQPRTPGHEFAGKVAQIKAPSLGFHEGDQAVVNPLMTCGKCRFCTTGQEHLCATRAVIGCQTPGGFAEFVRVPAANLRRLPPGLRPEVATLSDPLAVAIHAADLAGDIKGKNCLVFGAGPLGLLMVHVLKLRGAAFVAVSDITQPRLARAAKFEPSMIIDAGADPDYTTLKGMSIDICVELAGGSSPALAKAILTVRRGGLVLQVAQRPPTEVICAQLIFGEKRIQGVFGQTGRNFDQALEMLGNGTTPGNLLLTDFYTLDNIQQAFDRVRSPEALKVIVRPG